MTEFLGMRYGETPSVLKDGKGKPFLPPPYAATRISWAHRHGHVLLGYCDRDRDIGVDLEEIGAAQDPQGIAETFFTATEAGWLAAQPPLSRALAFCGLWCAKEAVLKAQGTGIAGGMRTPSFTEDECAALLLLPKRGIVLRHPAFHLALSRIALPVAGRHTLFLQAACLLL